MGNLWANQKWLVDKKKEKSVGASRPNALSINTFSCIDRVPIGVLLNGTCRTRFLLLL